MVIFLRGRRCPVPAPTSSPSLSVVAAQRSLLAGYQTAGEKGYDWMHKIGFAGIVAFTIYVIIDYEFPRVGLIRMVSTDELLLNLRASMPP